MRGIRGATKWNSSTIHLQCDAVIFCLRACGTGSTWRTCRSAQRQSNAIRPWALIPIASKRRAKARAIATPKLWPIRMRSKFPQFWALSRACQRIVSMQKELDSWSTSSTGALVRICPPNIFTIWDAINGSFRRAPPSMARRVGKSKTVSLSGTCNLSGQKRSKLEFVAIWNLDLLNLKHVIDSGAIGSLLIITRIYLAVFFRIHECRPILRDRLQFLVDFLSASWSTHVRLHSREESLCLVGNTVTSHANAFYRSSWTNALTRFGGLHVCASSRNLTSKRWQNCNQTTAVSFTS